MGLCNDYKKIDKAAKYSALGLKNLCIMPKNLARFLGSRREHCWVYLSIFNSTPEKLILKSIFPLKAAENLLSGSRKGEVGA